MSNERKYSPCQIFLVFLEFKTQHSKFNTMARALWNGTVIAESDKYELVEGNVYFPASAIKQEYFKDSATHTKCPWKGTASYFTIEVNGQQNADAAWFYPKTMPSAKHIEGYVAFWKGVTVEK